MPYLTAVGRQYGKQEVPHRGSLLESYGGPAQTQTGSGGRSFRRKTFLSKCVEQQQDGVWSEEFRRVPGDLGLGWGFAEFLVSY